MYIDELDMLDLEDLMLTEQRVYMAIEELYNYNNKDLTMYRLAAIHDIIAASIDQPLLNLERSGLEIDKVTMREFTETLFPTAVTGNILKNIRGVLSDTNEETSDNAAYYYTRQVLHDYSMALFKDRYCTVDFRDMREAIERDEKCN